MATKHICNGGNKPIRGIVTPGCPACDEFMAKKAWERIVKKKSRETNEKNRVINLSKTKIKEG